MWINCRELQGTKTSSVRRRIRQAFAEARAYAPSLLVLEDVDVIAPGGPGGNAGDGRLAEEMADLTSELHTLALEREALLRSASFALPGIDER